MSTAQSHRARRRPAGYLPVRTHVALSAGRTATRLSRVLGRGRGATIGGDVALRLDPDSLRQLARGRTVVLVTGTNDSSLTTRMIAEAVRGHGPVASNASGATLRNGVVAALDTDRDAPYAVLELDEADLDEVARATRADVIVLLNVSREYGRGISLDRTVRRLRDAVATVDWPCRVVANVDDPLVCWAARQAERPVPVSAGLCWHGDALLCRDCRAPLEWDGDRWWCTGCAFARPDPDWWIEDGRLHPGGVALPDLALTGRAAGRSALLATAAAAQLGVAPAEALAAIAAVTDVAGGQARFRLDDHDVRLFTVRNPAGWHEMLHLATSGTAPVVFAMDALGIEDTAALWDVPAELLGDVEITVAGLRRYDLATWLTAGGARARVGDADPVAAVRALPAGEVLVVTNHSAFKALRRRLAG